MVLNVGILRYTDKPLTRQTLDTTNPGHDKPWTRQTLDTTNPGHDKGQNRTGGTLGNRVSSKQTNKIFGSNRNKPKHSLFRFIFGLFRETKIYFIRFVSFRFGPVSKQPKQTDLFRNKPKKRKNTQETENLVIKLC
jgi:hypothetical protein